MKKLFSISTFICASLFLLLFTSCEGNKEYNSYLGPKQLNLLVSPKSGTTVVFDENGTRTTTTVGQASISPQRTQENRGGLFTGGTTFYKEIGTVYYDVISPPYTKVVIRAYSEDPYRSESDFYKQEIIIDYSQYAIDFNNKLSSKTIHGVTYTDVVLGIDPYRNDTLFWKKDIGILGWKKADQNFTAYRVF